jgi:hypothetical protein
MATRRLHPDPRGVLELTLAAVLAVALAAALAGSLTDATSRSSSHGSAESADEEEEELEGDAPTSRHQPTDVIEIAFPRESYAPGARAALRFWSPARRVTVQVFRVGAERARTIGNETMQGVPVTTPRRAASVRSGTRLAIPVGNWRSGLYFARATAAGGRVGFAPFVVRPRRLGQSRVAVVLPTRTWQAYNFRDDDGDGRGDTWYANRRHTTVQLGRPYLRGGVPPYFRLYDLSFLHWLHETGRSVDILSQAELEGTTGGRLAQAYDAIVFPGHHEYVTTREYDVVQRYRDLGGNLAFLSANNFFWRIDLRNNVITRVARWRDLGRPEAGLIGVQYRGNDTGTHRAPWIVRSAETAPWLFAGTPLADGMPVGTAGIEIDQTVDASPRDVTVIADVRDLFGAGFTAQMTYYENDRGARVFAAGAFTLAGSARRPQIRQLLANLWTRLTAEEPAQVVAE